MPPEVSGAAISSPRILVSLKPLAVDYNSTPAARRRVALRVRSCNLEDREKRASGRTTGEIRSL